MRCGMKQVKQGGLRDKPGQARDYYHTCYCLSGLSIAQHSDEGGPWVLGPPSNLVKRCGQAVACLSELHLRFDEDSIPFASVLGRSNFPFPKLVPTPQAVLFEY